MVDFAKLSDEKILFGFAKKVYFDERAHGIRSTRDKSVLRLLKSPSIVVSASGVSSSQKNLSEKQFINQKIPMNIVIE